MSIENKGTDKVTKELFKQPLKNPSLEKTFSLILDWSRSNKVALAYTARRGNQEQYSKEWLEEMKEINLCNFGTATYDNGGRNLLFFPARAGASHYHIEYNGNLIAFPESQQGRLWTSPKIWHFVTERPVAMIKFIAEITGNTAYETDPDSFSHTKAVVILDDALNANNLVAITASSQDIDFENL